MGSVVTGVLFLKSAFPVNVWMTMSIQYIMTKKSSNIGFCNLTFFIVREKFTAFQQIVQKSSGACLVGNRTDIIRMYQICLLYTSDAADE